MPENFFTDKQIKKLRRIAGGDTYTIIYLKMLLASLQTNGELFFDGIEDTIAEEIALDIDEDADNVLVTLQFLEKTGLIELHEESITLSALPAMVGSEGAGAERMRTLREKKKASLCDTKTSHCDTNVTRPLHSCDVEKRREDKDIDKDIDKEKRRKEKTPTAYYPDDPDLDEAFRDYVEMRKRIKAPMTEKAVELAKSKLDKLGNGNIRLMIEIVNQSTMNSWKGLFPLHDDKKKEDRLAFIDNIDWSDMSDFDVFS